jgi:hypothetical protein
LTYERRTHDETYSKDFLFESVHQRELFDPHSYLVSKRNISTMLPMLYP